MSGIVVVLELEEPQTARIIGAGMQPVEGEGVIRVHAAPGDPDVPRDPGPVTFCGLDTSGLAVDPWEPTGPGESWYPPRWHHLVCDQCDTALRLA